MPRVPPASVLSVAAVALALAAWSLVRTLTGGGPLHLALDVGGVDLGVHVDVLSSVLLAFVALMSGLVAAYTVRNVAGQARTRRLARLQLLTTAGLLVLVAGASLPVMALGWTVSGLALAATVAHTGAGPALRAARQVRRTLLAGDAALWAAVVLAVLTLPTVDRAELPTRVLPVPATAAVALLLVLACIPRSALVPAHRWLPETAEAPSPVSALLHAGVVNGAGMLLTLLWPVVSAVPAVLVLLLVVGCASVLIGTVVSRARSDTKGQLAASTTSQMGYMSVQLGLGLPAAAVLHLVGHGFWKSWLFLRAGGTVSRLREEPVGSRPAGADRVLAVAPAVVLAVLATAVLAAPALVHSWSVLGASTLVPVLATLSAVAVAARGADRPAPGRTAPGTRVRVAAVGLLAAAGASYLWLLAGAELLLASSLPAAPVWSPAAAAAAVVCVLVAAGLVLLVVRLSAGPVGHAAVMASAGGLPWRSRRLGAGHVRSAPGPDVPGRAGADRARVDVAATVQRAVADLSPAWPLRTAVAASPLAGLERLGVEDAAPLGRALLGWDGLLPAAEYARHLRQGRITPDHLAAAVRLAAADDGRSVTDAEVDWQVEGLLLAVRPGVQVPSTDDPTQAAVPPVPGPTDEADAADERRRQVCDLHSSSWCQRAWSRAEDGRDGPFRVWRSHAVLFSYDVVTRTRGASAVVRSLPADPSAALGEVLDRLGLQAEESVAYLRALLVSAPGWTAHARWRDRQDGGCAATTELLALRACLDLLAGSGPRLREARPLTGAEPSSPAGGPLPDGRAADGQDPRHLWQLAFELGYAEPLLLSLGAPARLLVDRASEGPAPQVQWVSCIDVRSERVRRHLDGDGVQTHGFAGFFGVDLLHRTAAGPVFELSPAIVRPGVASTTSAVRSSVRSALSAAVAAASRAPLTPLVVAEAAGACAGAAALARTLAPARWGALVARWQDGPDPWGAPGLRVDAEPAHRVALAAGALRGAGLAGRLAPLVVLCGHRASVQNNAFASAYACGACGGSDGAVNARAMAGLLNDPEVRVGLRDEGLEVPPGTWFVAAMHDTTTDDLELDPLAAVPASHAAAVERLRRRTTAASQAVRKERLPSLAGAARPGTSGARYGVRDRAEDWAQPSPEWGLVGNAAIVVGPRNLTAGLDLGGRVFLHSYDAADDPDARVLETLLTAPVVVAHWISSQYRASAAAPGVLGSGDKTTHNVVGDVGVLSGAHGDLRLGLPWQALASADPGDDPAAGRHEPLRLLAVLHARPDAVQQVVGRHQVLRDLVSGGWVRVAVVDPADGSTGLLTRRLAWAPSSWAQGRDASQARGTAAALG